MANLSEIVQGPVGIFSLDIYQDGELIEHFEEKNLIVDNSKSIFANLLGGNFTGRNVAQIGFGTNGTAPAAGNTGLTGAYIKSIDTVTYPSSNIVQFNFSLSGSEANGMAIMEFGLFTAGSVLFARKTRSVALNKASDIAFTGAWSIQF